MQIIDFQWYLYSVLTDGPVAHPNENFNLLIRP